MTDKKHLNEEELDNINGGALDIFDEKNNEDKNDIKASQTNDKAVLTK